MPPSSGVIEMIAPADVQADADAAKRDALAFVADNKIDVIDLPSLQRAVTTRAAIGEKVKAIEQKLAPPKSWAHKLHKWFCDLEAAALAPYAELDAYERRQISEFKVVQDQRREARERALAEELRRDAEARAALEAAALESSGEHALAVAVMEEAIAAPAPIAVLPDETKQIKGLGFTRRWLWRYKGGPKAIKDTPPAVVARTMQLIPREYLCVDEAKLGAYVRAMKASGKVPGIDIYYVDDPVR